MHNPNFYIPAFLSLKLPCPLFFFFHNTYLANFPFLSPEVIFFSLLYRFSLSPCILESTSSYVITRGEGLRDRGMGDREGAGVLSAGSRTRHERQSVHPRTRRTGQRVVWFLSLANRASVFRLAALAFIRIFNSYKSTDGSTYKHAQIYSDQHRHVQTESYKNSNAHKHI